MGDEKDPYEQQQDELDDAKPETPDRDTELEGEDVRPGGDSPPQKPQQA